MAENKEDWLMEGIEKGFIATSTYAGPQQQYPWAVTTEPRPYGNALMPTSWAITSESHARAYATTSKTNDDSCVTYGNVTQWEK